LLNLDKRRSGVTEVAEVAVGKGILNSFSTELLNF
jgi:hypothetical protein